MSDKVSYFSRFFVKFVEIIAAGLATAVGGYLIAYLGGHLSAPLPAPAAVQVAPSASGLSRSVPAQSAPPVSADTNEQRLAPQQDANAPAAQPARKTVNAAKPVVPRKHMKTDTGAAESKPNDEESVEARVRAALANVDANRPAPPDVPLHPADVQPAPAAVGPPPLPVDSPSSTGTVAVSPRAADLQPQPAPQAPVQPAPLTAVEIKSRPVTDVNALPAPQPAPPAPEDKGFFATLKRIPDMLRPDPPGEAPRPPMPVGQ